MEQPQANPTKLCLQNCGFYGSSQFGGMCSKCFQENVKQRSEVNKAMNSPSNSYYAASNMPVTSSSSQTPSSFAAPSSSSSADALSQQAQQHEGEEDDKQSRGVSFSNDQDEIVGRMDEDNNNDATEPLTPTPSTVIMNNNNTNNDMAVEQSTSSSELMADDVSTPMPDAATQTNPILVRPLSHSATAPTLPIAIPASLPVTFEPASLGAESMSPSAASASSVNTRKSAGRCVLCRKKVGLTGFDCRCGGLFCSTHRYPDEHDCKFDYKEYERKILEGSLKKVVAAKVTGI